MIKIIFLICSLLLLGSCKQEKNKTPFNISELSQTMKQDSIVTQYFEAMANSFKIRSENEINMKKYIEITNQHNQDICNIKKEKFNGNIPMENLALANCKIITLSEVFNHKYPFVKDLNKRQRKELITSLKINPILDIDAIKKKAEKHVEH